MYIQILLTSVFPGCVKHLCNIIILFMYLSTTNKKIKSTDKKEKKEKKEQIFLW